MKELSELDQSSKISHLQKIIKSQPNSLRKQRDGLISYIQHDFAYLNNNFYNLKNSLKKERIKRLSVAIEELVE